MKTKTFIAVMLASLVSCMAASTAFAEPIGSAVRIVNKVTGEIDQRAAGAEGQRSGQSERGDRGRRGLARRIEAQRRHQAGAGPGLAHGARQVRLRPGAVDRHGQRQSPDRRLPLHHRPVAQGQLRAAHAVRLDHRARHHLRRLRRRRRRARGCCCWKARCASAMPPTSAPTSTIRAASCTSRRRARSTARSAGRRRRAPSVSRRPSRSS